MKSLTCEMCNSTGVLKQDGIYVCQSCGTKYTVEEAKKMMIEGTVDVQGTVKVDNTDSVIKYLENARRALEKEDWEDAEKYYNMVEQNEPSNIEAIFYSAYAKAKNCLTVNDIHKRKSVFNALTNSIGIIDDNFDASKSNVILPILNKITNDVIGIFGSYFVYTEYKNGYNIKTGDNKGETYQLFVNLACEMYTTLNNICPKLPAGSPEICEIHKLRYRISNFMLSENSHLNTESRLVWVNNCELISKQIKQLDPSFPDVDYDELRSSVKSNGIKSSVKNTLIGIGVFIVVFVLAFWYYIA